MSAAIYCRISKDRTGAGLGVERQEADCRELAAKLGLDVAEVFVDNDLSAMSGKPRPAYDHMLTAVDAGQFEAVIVWHQDRLLRRNVDLEGYIAVCEPKAVPTYTVRAGTVDLSTPSGRAIARTLAAWASYEVETSTARVKAAKLQAAQAGKFSGGQRPYGYEPGCTAVRLDEAVHVQEIADRVIRGESFNRVAMDLNRRGITTTHGKQWNALKVRNLLSHKRYAGIREHHDAEYEATWPAILSRETWDRLQATIRVNRERHKQRGPGRKYLLSGYVYCGVCGSKLHTKPRAERGSSTRYVCSNKPEAGLFGCGTVSRNIAPTEHLITEAVLYRLDSDGLAKALQMQGDAADEIQDLLAVRNAQRQRHDALADDYATGLLSKQQLARANQASQAELDRLDKLIDAYTRKRTGAHLLPAGTHIREAWAKGDLAWRRQLVGLLIDRVIIHPSDTTGMTKAQRWRGWVFKPDDIEVRWIH